MRHRPDREVVRFNNARLLETLNEELETLNTGARKLEKTITTNEAEIPEA